MNETKPWDHLPEKHLSWKSDQSRFDWPDMTFFAAAEDIPFQDVEVVTLKQHCRDRNTEEAFSNSMEMDLLNVDKWLARYLDELEPQTFREFVQVRREPRQGPRVTVGVNADIVDDDMMDYALTLLEQVEDYTTPGVYEFGNSVTINPGDLF